MLFKPLHAKNAFCGITVNFSFRVIPLKEVHSLKTLSPNETMFGGSSVKTSSEQPWNAPAPIFKGRLLNTIVCRVLLSLNASLPIAVTAFPPSLSGMTTFTAVPVNFFMATSLLLIGATSKSLSFCTAEIVPVVPPDFSIVPFSVPLPALVLTVPVS